MGTNSLITWTGDTWNPLRAQNLENSKSGWACVLHGEGCVNCYADRINREMGTGLPFVASSLEKIEVSLSNKGGQTSIDWPLRAQGNRTIFLGSMTDWMGNFYKKEWQALLLATMGLASNHAFITLTKRWSNLFSMLLYINTLEPTPGIAVPADKPFVKAILRSHANRAKFGKHLEKSLTVQAFSELAVEKPVKKLTQFEEIGRIPWPPRNIVFGISVCTIAEAEKAVPLLINARKTFPDALFAVSQEPALERIDWVKLGLPKGVLDWLIWGGESGENAREATGESWCYASDVGRELGIPVFWKQTGNVLAKKLGLKDEKGSDFADPKIAEFFPDCRQETIDMSGRLV